MNKKLRDAIYENIIDRLINAINLHDTDGHSDKVVNGLIKDAVDLLIELQKEE